MSRSPGAGRIVSDIICGRDPWIDAGVLNVDRFSDTYPTDTSLRARCEEVYAHHYHAIY